MKNTLAAIIFVIVLLIGAGIGGKVDSQNAQHEYEVRHGLPCDCGYEDGDTLSERLKDLLS